MPENTENTVESTTPETKKKKFSKLELLVAMLAFVFLMLYFFPKVVLNNEQKVNTALKTSAAVYTKLVIEKFSADKSLNVKSAADDISNQLNETYKNPLNKKNGIFTLGTECPGCINVYVDETMNSIIITGYDKNMKTVVRTVIKPPSFVTYEREDQ